MNILAGEKVLCHRTGFTQSCRELVKEGYCTRWYHIIGQDPNTGERGLPVTVLEEGNMSGCETWHRILGAVARPQAKGAG